MKYDGLTGKVIVPGDPEYPKAKQEYNKAINKNPCTIVYCMASQDVANAISWSKKNGVHLRIRSGGHNYEGYSTGNRKLVIDTSCMNKVKVNPEDDTVEVQAGTKLLKLYETLSRFGYVFPGGTCPTVAISGLVLGGGVGLSTRYLGLTADSLLAAEMIDANGLKLTSNNIENPDLFWALRGAGGGNYGVVTAYKFHLHKAKKITLIQLRWDNNLPARRQFIEVWQTWLEGLDYRISAFAKIYKLGAWVNSFFYGTPAEAEKVLAPLLGIPGITFRKIECMDFIEAVKVIGKSYPAREAFKATGRFIRQKLSDYEIDQLIYIIDKAPSDADSLLSFYSLGGAVRDISMDKTAFFYRQADYILGISSAWKTKKERRVHIKWVEAGFRLIYTFSSGSYVNFPYSNMYCYDYTYYGLHVGKLEKIKRKYDPCNVFSFPQSIHSY